MSNLIPMNKRTKDEQRKIATKGGIKSGESRRERKTIREQLLLLLEKGDTQSNMCVALVEKALNGDVKSFEVIRDTIGEKPVEKVISELNIKQALVEFCDEPNKSENTD